MCPPGVTECTRTPRVSSFCLFVRLLRVLIFYHSCRSRSVILRSPRGNRSGCKSLPESFQVIPFEGALIEQGGEQPAPLRRDNYGVTSEAWNFRGNEKKTVWYEYGKFNLLISRRESYTEKKENSQRRFARSSSISLSVIWKNLFYLGSTNFIHMSSQKYSPKVLKVSSTDLENYFK